MGELALRDYIQIFLKRKWFIVAAVVACLGPAIALTALATPEYEASAQLFIGLRQVEASNVQEGVAVTQLSKELLQTYAKVIRTTPITQRAVDRAKLRVTATKLSQQLVAEPIVETQLLQLAYRNPDPAVAERTVNAVAQTFVVEIEKIDGSAKASQKPAINVSVVQPALRPGAPVSPRRVVNVGIGLALGLALGVGAALLIEYLDVTIKDKTGVEQLQLPVLAAIPKIRTRPEEIYLEGDNQSAFAETLRKLRTAVDLHAAHGPIQVILVTSPYSGEGKTTTALNLAAAYANAGGRTLLLEADLRRPQLQTLFPTNGTNGFTLALLERVTLEEAIIPTDSPRLDCLPAGAIPQTPVEILSSPRTSEILSKLRTDYQSVIIDAPPLLPVADSSVLVPHVDGVILVARWKETRPDRLKEATTLVEQAGGRILGVVLNAVPMDDSNRYYHHYYSSQGRS